ncbi:Uncharacterised protein [Salmonella enterica subsp. enterica serovar Oranienburg]|nr:Uncharacterised protein [Salmonella enterica subsp. enterica serovar Oranienburg]
MANIEPRWLIEARKHIGLTEIKGAKHNPEIVQFWRDIKRGGIKDDETPWCAAFVGAMLERVGIRSTRFESAKILSGLGREIRYTGIRMYRCIYPRRRWARRLRCRTPRQWRSACPGWNQGDAVNIRAFPTSRVSGYRWPAGEPRNTALLPVGDAATSTNEA